MYIYISHISLVVFQCIINNKKYLMNRFHFSRKSLFVLRIGKCINVYIYIYYIYIYIYIYIYTYIVTS